MNIILETVCLSKQLTHEAPSRTRASKLLYQTFSTAATIYLEYYTN